MMVRASAWYGVGSGGRVGDGEAHALTVRPIGGTAGVMPGLSITLSRATRSGKTEHCRLDLGLAEADRLGTQLGSLVKEITIAARAAKDGV